MLLLLVYWSYLAVVFLNLGFGFQKLLRLKTQAPILTIVFGMFSVTMLASIWAIWGRVNIEFQCLLLALQVLIVFTDRAGLSGFYREFGLQIKKLNRPLRIHLLFALTLLLLSIYSGNGFVDNETYYVQTIKWLNEYGLVKGLANLHIFFGQTGGWHILQSAFSFSFLSNHFNQLNGFCFLMGNLFAAIKLQDYFRGGGRPDLWSGLLPVANVVLLAYCAAPSPGLALAVLCIILFGYFVENYDNYKPDTLLVLWVLALFVVYLKITILPVILVPMAYALKHFKKMATNMGRPFLIGLMVSGLWIVKNDILTGFPLYPSKLFKNYFHADYVLPEPYYEFSFNRAKCYDFFISGEEFAKSSLDEIFLKWLFYSSGSLVNAIILLLALTVPFWIQRYFNQRTYWILYGVMIIALLYIWLGSPQYRFMVPFVLFFVLILLSIYLREPKKIHLMLFTSSFVAAAFWVFSPEIGEHQRDLKYKNRPFSARHLGLPDENSRLKTHYQQYLIGNLRYYSPDDSTYIWATGDGNLPCVNKKQIDYFKKKLHYIPQMRTTELRDGFYSFKIQNP